MLRQTERRAAELIHTLPLEREQVGRRLLDVSRSAFERISVLALAFHTTGERRFMRRAETEMRAVAAFADWNPSHFLDVAEMAAAVGIGYDWLYDEFDAPTRQTLRQALIDHALSLPLGGWQQATSNWNSVCFGGLAIAAAAIARDEPRWLVKLIGPIAQHNPNALTSFAPDGVYPEGPNYWVYGATYQVLMIEALRSAGGDGLGLADAPGFLSSGAFMAHTRGPGGGVFNFSDGHETVDWTPALLWIAYEAGRPEWLAPWRHGGWAEAVADDSRFRALNPLWWVKTRPDAPSPAPPRSFCGDGPNPVACFRESWNDADALYLAIKGGEARHSHGHMDAGGFVLEAGGTRWAVDLGTPDYHGLEEADIDLWNLAQESDRWRVFQYHNLAHNTLTTGDAAHRVNGRVDITAFEPLPAPDEAPGHAVGGVTLDMAAALGPDVASATRRFVFHAGPERRVEIHDTLQPASPPPGDTTTGGRDLPVTWTLITRAHAISEGTCVVLRQDGRSLRLTVSSSCAGRWIVSPCDTPDGFVGPAEPGATRLRWVTAAARDAPLKICMTLTPLPHP